MCQKLDCPIFENCDKEHEQAIYCRKIELLVHLSKIGKFKRPRFMFAPATMLPVLM